MNDIDFDAAINTLGTTLESLKEQKLPFDEYLAGAQRGYSELPAEFRFQIVLATLADWLQITWPFDEEGDALEKVMELPGAVNRVGSLLIYLKPEVQRLYSHPDWDTNCRREGDGGACQCFTGLWARLKLEALEDLMRSQYDREVHGVTGSAVPA